MLNMGKSTFLSQTLIVIAMDELDLCHIFPFLHGLEHQNSATQRCVAYVWVGCVDIRVKLKRDDPSWP